MPFGSAPSIDWSVLPPLETKPAAGPASFGDLENAGLLPKAQKQLYRLALIEADGSLRIPTDNELQVRGSAAYRRLPRGRRRAGSHRGPCARSLGWVHAPSWSPSLVRPLLG